MPADERSFQACLRDAISGGRKIWPDGRQSCLLLTYDMDADSSWIMRGLDEPVARSAGQFEVNVGTPCILELMNWFGLNTTFFTPGWIAEQYPQGIPAGTTAKGIAREFQRATDISVGERTVRRALGRK